MTTKIRQRALFHGRLVKAVVMALGASTAMAQQSEPVQLPGIVMRWKSQMPEDMATTSIEAIERCMSGSTGLRSRRAELDTERQALQIGVQPLREERAALEARRAALDKQFELLRLDQRALAEESRELDARKQALQKTSANKGQDARTARADIDQFNRRVKLHNEKVRQSNQRGQEANRARDELNRSVVGFSERVDLFNKRSGELDQRVNAFAAELRAFKDGCEGERRLVK